ncbi:hypothetical protein N0V93_007270 [Gnomoniopsis smithogilvyi]|uniref:DUF6987 domain-containing protein n=1 Tax=Gnomoniopsis smithogilvyi TaxID=1191159 RepID=A0A9W8YPS0_9PEZI|nr:hypothetical protein N0V93_007270 [Gnomoniopsis smithogilvyi]
MSDTHPPPGGWPWGKDKKQAGSEVASQSQADKGVQEPELQQLEPEAEGERTPKQAESQIRSKAGDAKSSLRSPESVTNKSVKYEDELEKPVSVQAPSSTKSFSRTGKEPSETNGEVEEPAQSEAATEKAGSKKDDIEDEAKDLTEPTETAGTEAEGQSEKGTSQAQSEKGTSEGGARSGFGSMLSGAKNMFGSSKQSGTDYPDSVKQLQELQSSGGGETLTAPGEQSTEDEDTPAETQEGTETSTEHSEGVSGEELRPEDSITHAADNSHLPTETAQTAQTSGLSETAPLSDSTEDLSETQALTDAGHTAAPTEGQTMATSEAEGLTEGQLPTETEAGQTELPEGAEATEGQTEGVEGEVEGAEGQVEGAEGEVEGAAEGAEGAAEGVEGEAEGAVEGAEGQVPKEGEDATSYASGYETATVNTEDIDFSILKGCKVNKLGNVVNDQGQAIGRIKEGILSHLIGRKVDENGIIWNDSGKEIGRAEPIPDNELQDMLEGKPFESFEGNVIDAKGWVTWEGQTVGKIIEGDLKALQGKTVDPDGEVLDKNGNVIGKAERYEEPEAEPEPEPEAIDLSILAGKRVNKAGKLVDSAGVIFGRVIDGDVKGMIGRMCNKNGEIVSESGDVLGHAELVSEGEREGSKEGPFAELEGLTVAKDGTVVTPSGDIVGRLVKGDPKVLAGRAVDEDGDVVDKNGNTLGHAERWEPEPEEVVEREKGPLEGLTVNNDGNVVDKHGNIIAKLTSGDPNICAGKEIDGDGDVVNAKGMTVGHVNLLQDIKEEEPEGETEEEAAARLEKEQDKKLAIQMANALENCLDKINPILKMITSKIDAAEAQKEEDRDEEALVKEVKPLIEEGGNILREAHGVIRGLDPDGHIQANAKHKSGTREATPEEFHLAEVIKELTGHVTETIEAAKKKLEGMPHAEKELNPLWGLLGEPLFQIIAAVGLLLTGVLGIVGNLLKGLGLGGIVDGLLGTLGISRLLDGLGLGSITGALTGKKKGKK